MHRGDPVSGLLLLAPARDLLAPRRNPEATPRKPRATSRKPRPHVLPDAALQLYAGHEAFLVRTALVRSEAWEQQRHTAVVITSSRQIITLCAHARDRDPEVLICLAMDRRMNVVAIYEVARAEGWGAEVELQRLLKIPLLCGASSVVVVTNHADGDPTPRPGDLRLSALCREAMGCIGVPLVDYAIVARGGAFSLLDAGLLNPKSR